jgi:hypothetical protein
MPCRNIASTTRPPQYCRTRALRRPGSRTLAVPQIVLPRRQTSPTAANDRKSQKTAVKLEEMSQSPPTESVLQSDYAGTRMPRDAAAPRINSRARPRLPRRAYQMQEALPPYPLRAGLISTASYLRHYLIPPLTTVTRFPYHQLPVHSHVEIATTVLPLAG